MQFFRQKGFDSLGITKYKGLYKLSFFGYLQYCCVMNSNIANNVILLRYLYKLFKIQQYLETVGIKGLTGKIKQKLMIRRRKQCK